MLGFLIRELQLLTILIFINQLLYVYILDIHNFGCHELEGKTQ